MNEQHVSPEPSQDVQQPVKKTEQELAQQSLQDVKKRINALFSSIYIAKLLGNKLKFYKDIYHFVSQNFDALGKDETVCIGPRAAQDVRNSVNTLKKLIMEIPITEDFGLFLESWCDLILSWNYNTLRDNNLHLDCSMLIRFSKHHFTMMELFDFTKTMLVQQKKMSNYSLPSIEIAKHYFLSMQGSGKAEEVPTSGPLLETKQKD